MTRAGCQSDPDEQGDVRQTAGCPEQPGRFDPREEVWSRRSLLKSWDVRNELKPSIFESVVERSAQDGSATIDCRRFEATHSAIAFVRLVTDRSCECRNGGRAIVTFKVPDDRPRHIFARQSARIAIKEIIEHDPRTISTPCRVRFRWMNRAR